MTPVSKIFIGTSGWSYPHWKEYFYPNDLPSKKWLACYASQFSTVEVNTTFYHTPSPKTVENWQSAVSTNFIFSLKAHRYITHQKKLHDCQISLNSFYKSILPLKSAGLILFQLPPSFKENKDRLIEFMTLLDPQYKYVFEFRHNSWYTSEIYHLLEKNKIALCITDLNGTLSPEEITSDFTYIRLHGPKKAYQGSYGSKNLKIWKKKIEVWASKFSVYCYFDNDEKAYAIQDAKLLETQICDQ